MTYSRYLETLCDHLYDSLRPRVLHEPKLEVLCELCTVLQALMALDADDEDEEHDEDEMTVNLRSKDSLGHLRFATLLETVLQDAQTRLVFRAQAVMQSEVLRYSPSSEDLDYPDKLKGGRRLSTLFPSAKDADAGTSSLMFELPSSEAQSTWYPTLKKTLWVLSKLHTYVKVRRCPVFSLGPGIVTASAQSTIFEDFAGEAVTLCRQSLSIAAAQIAKKPNASSLDGQLFTIRHLLILKEMVRSFDLVQIDRAVDFGSVTGAPRFICMALAPEREYRYAHWPAAQLFGPLQPERPIRAGLERRLSPFGDNHDGREDRSRCSAQDCLREPHRSIRSFGYPYATNLARSRRFPSFHYCICTEPGTAERRELGVSGRGQAAT